MPNPFVRAALTVPVVAAVLVGSAGPAAANDWTIKKPPVDTCYDVIIDLPDGEPRDIRFCPQV